MITFILVHSPLVGSYTWKLTGEYLSTKGHKVVIPKLTNDCLPHQSFSDFHINTITSFINGIEDYRDLVLVSHSGAGVLLPLLYQIFKKRNPKLLFVDSDLPISNKSRLDLFDKIDAKQFRKACSNGIIPLWSENDLKEVIYDIKTRKAFVKEFKEVPLSLYEEKIQFSFDYLKNKSGYLLLSETYQNSFKMALNNNWVTAVYESNHFALLNEPIIVGEKILKIAYKLLKINNDSI